MEESKADSSDNLSPVKDTLRDEEIIAQTVKSRVMPLFHRIQLEKDRYHENQSISTDHTTNVCHISISSMSRFMVSSSQESIIVWSLKGTPKRLVKVNISEPQLKTLTVA